MTRPALHPGHGLDARERELPQWARAKLLKLRQRVRELEQLTGELPPEPAANPQDTNIYVYNPGEPESPGDPLPRNSEIRVEFGPRWGDALHVFPARDGRGVLWAKADIGRRIELILSDPTQVGLTIKEIRR